MAITAAFKMIDGSKVPRVAGNRRQGFFVVTLDNSYPTNGYPITLGLFGFSEALEVVDPGITSTARSVFWDITNSKLKIFNSQGSEVNNGTDLSAETVNVFVIGL